MFKIQINKKIINKMVSNQGLLSKKVVIVAIISLLWQLFSCFRVNFRCIVFVVCFVVPLKVLSHLCKTLRERLHDPLIEGLTRVGL